MDLFLLHAVAAEACDRLTGRALSRAASLGGWRFLLHFSTPTHDQLLISVRPDLSRLHLLGRGGRLPERPADRFTAILGQHLEGAVLESLQSVPWDRVVEMRFRTAGEGEAGVRILVVELLGRSANLLLLDGHRLILDAARPLKSAFRVAVVGAPYLPPPGREELAGLPLDPLALERLRGRLEDPAGRLAACSPLLARHLAAVAGGGPSARESAARMVLQWARDRAWSPVIESTRPLDSFAEGQEIDADDLIVSPWPLPAGDGALGTARHSTAFESASDAATVGFGIVERLREFRGLQEHHRTLVRREVGRLQSLASKLEDELARARDTERHRIFGEALLAGLGAARVEGATARVPDPYRPEGPPLEIPIDPARPLQENARRHFDRYKKGKRAISTIGTRLMAVEERLRGWRELQGPADELRSPGDVERLREAMGRLGLLHASPRGGKRAAPVSRRDPPARVRRLISPEGMIILVGKSGEENDTLTFRVASPWDFWLHAAGQPGAHVVVRNPRRLGALPDATLRVAAEIAAYYSGARGEVKADVHYTQRKHVHKRKGMPSGQVLLRRFRSIQVTPRLPVSSLQDV
jgi:predicted ribosome quality control (RQC) complex YloA/Tae2 family protein